MSEHVSSDVSTPTVVRLLVVDDEERFRESLAKRLTLRGFLVEHTDSGEEAIRMARASRPDVVLLDRKMPKMAGEDVLRELKKIVPEVQVIMLTGHATMESAAASGKLDAYAYLTKPCETEQLIATIEAAAREKRRAMARHEIPVVESKSFAGWLWGTHGSRPGVVLLGAVLFCLIALTPAPDSLLAMLAQQKTGDPIRDTAILGHSAYQKMRTGESISVSYCAAAKMKEGSPERAAKSAKVMMGTLTVAALFWATGALPIGFTAFLVGLLMYLFGVFPPNLVAKAYAADAVIFIMGVLAFAVGIAKTGLDRRIGLLLLGTSKSLTRFLFLFLPLLGMAAAFFSEHALVAFVAPILIVVYMSAVRTAGLTKDHALAVIFVLGICFAANSGGPGSPAAGGRNAVMVGILAEYNMAPSFGEWVKHGLPFVPVMCSVIALYFFLTLRRKVKVGAIDIARIVRRESEKIGKMSRQEWITAGVLAIVIVLWVISGEGEEGIGMGGPVLLGLVLLSVFRIMSWRDVNRISWDVVALYASACAMGAGLASTGAALWLARSFIDSMPFYFTHGTGLCVATSMFTGFTTQFMSDGATVSAIGPLAVPMATMAGDVSPIRVGLATAFASSFANCLIIGTPNNAIAYSLAKDYETGEQLVSLGDFLKHGLVVTALAMLVLWFGVFYLYWGQVL